MTEYAQMLYTILMSTHSQPRALHLLTAFFALVLVGVAVALKPFTVTLLVVTVLFLWWLSYSLELGLIVLAVLSLMNTWILSFHEYAFLFREFPQLAGLNAPVADFWTVALLIAFLLSQARHFWRGGRPHIVAPALHWYILFIVSAVVSLTNLSFVELSAGVKYILRFLVFVYVGYILLPVNICKTKESLERIMKAFAITGVVTAVMGVVSVLGNVWQVGGFVRAVPFAIFGWAPFGYQHILLAEVLTATLPLALFFNWKTQGKVKQWWGISALLMFVVALLTLSRAAWLTLAVEGVLFVALTLKFVDWKALLRKVKLPALLFGTLAVYMVGFLMLNPTVQSSNSARVELANISYMLFQEHPIIGQGVGSFVARLSEVSVFRLEFGDPLEAHGMMQKIGSEQGVVGLIAMGLFLVAIFSRLLKRIRSGHYSNEVRMYAFVGLFLALGPLMFQIFNTQYYSSKLWVPFGLAMATFVIYERDKKHGKVFAGDNRKIVITE